MLRRLSDAALNSIDKLLNLGENDRKRSKKVQPSFLAYIPSYIVYYHPFIESEERRTIVLSFFIIIFF